MRWSRFKDELDTSPLNHAAGTAIGDQSHDLAAGAVTPKKAPKKKVSKKKPSKKLGENATPQKRKLNEKGDEDGERTEIKEEDDWEVRILVW
jgi:hypothetical protein